MSPESKSFLSVLILMLLAGCASVMRNSSSLADVLIPNATTEQIRLATLSVFSAESYKVTEQSANTMEFERDATPADVARWGHYGEQGMRMRVIVKIEPYSESETLVKADAYIMRERRSDQEKITLPGRRPYESLLNRISELVAAGAKRR